MRIFRWLLLIANAFLLMMYVIAFIGTVVEKHQGVVVGLIGSSPGMPLLGNIVFMLITWRWCPEGKAASRIAGAFD